MGSKLKIRKLISVVVLTILIWVWADLALERQEDLSNVPVRIPSSTDPTLAAAFEIEGEFSNIVTIDKMGLIGPEKAINKMKSNRTGEELEFRLVPDELGLVESGIHTIDLLEYLRESVDSVTTLTGLDVEKCEPDTLQVRVEKLVKVPVKIQCIGPAQTPIEDARMDPPEVEMFIPESWPTGSHVAFVTLSPDDVERARMNPISRKPFVRILDKRRESETSVEVTMPSIMEQLILDAVPTPNFAFAINMTLQSQYNVELAPDQTRRPYSAIRFLATEQAAQAYKSSSYGYHVMLYIYDRDKDVDGFITRNLTYNFPPEFAGQIRLDQDPEKVEFRLVPKTNGGSDAGHSD
jgi:hypothetical protein